MLTCLLCELTYWERFCSPIKSIFSCVYSLVSSCFNLHIERKKICYIYSIKSTPFRLCHWFLLHILNALLLFGELLLCCEKCLSTFHRTCLKLTVRRFCVCFISIIWFFQTIFLYTRITCLLPINRPIAELSWGRMALSKLCQCLQILWNSWWWEPPHMFLCEKKMYVSSFLGVGFVATFRSFLKQLAHLTCLVCRSFDLLTWIRLGHIYFIIL